MEITSLSRVTIYHNLKNIRQEMTQNQFKKVGRSGFLNKDDQKSLTKLFRNLKNASTSVLQLAMVVEGYKRLLIVLEDI